MLKLHKHYLTNEHRQPIAVQIPIDEFEKIEEVLENLGLVKLMEEADNDEVLSKDEGVKYYFSLNSNDLGRGFFLN